MRAILLATACLIALPSRAPAQAPRSNLGLAGAGALGVFAGGAGGERSSQGAEVGAILDLGWMRGRSVRLQGEVSMLRSTLTEFILVEDSTYHGDFFDLSASLTSVVFLGDPSERLSAYMLAGVGVHALSSTFGTLSLDRRYNTNRFGSHVGAGVTARIGRSGNRGAYVEFRRVIANEVNRSLLRLGGVVYFGDLAPSR